MGILQPAERTFAAGLSKLVYCNPFLPERIEYEREALGDEFVEKDAVWSVRPNAAGERPNLGVLLSRARSLMESMRSRLADGRTADAAEIELYQDLLFYVQYHRTRDLLADLFGEKPPRPKGPAECFRHIEQAYQHYLRQFGLEPRYEPAHLLAGFFQIYRAFYYIFRYLVGSAIPAARLRGAVWQSVFTDDLRRYMRCLHDRMRDFTTLIVGPSGTGKELVARAIALSRYVPFDTRSMNFVDDHRKLFHPLNLSALSPTLIESELFGHRRGAFTGALDDRPGWMEVCGPLGTVFLDEVGEIDAAIQVKLLRVLQTRQFQRLGDTQPRPFEGKVIAATNRDLAVEMQKGRIREDFFYRLCSDMIRPPSLQEVLRESPEELAELILFIARRMTGAIYESGPDKEAHRLAEQVLGWIHKHLGSDYPWPGNFRELEQCVANILIRGEYHPTLRGSAAGQEDLAETLRAGRITAEQLLQRYCTIVYAQTGSYEETARRLDIDRRTVKAKIDNELLAQMRA